MILVDANLNSSIVGNNMLVRYFELLLGCELNQSCAACMIVLYKSLCHLQEKDHWRMMIFTYQHDLEMH